MECEYIQILEVIMFFLLLHGKQTFRITTLTFLQFIRPQTKKITTRLQL